MRIPLEAAKYIKLHRTEYQNMSDEEAIRAYDEQIYKEFIDMLPFLPDKDKVDSIVEIGGGLSLIQCYLMRVYPNATLTLIDSDGYREDVAGFHPKYFTYTSRELCDKILLDNGPIFHSWENAGYSDVIEADLVISLLSWGYHFPLKDYKVKSPCVIADLRQSAEHHTFNFELIKSVDNYNRVKFSL